VCGASLIPHVEVCGAVANVEDVDIAAVEAVERSRLVDDAETAVRFATEEHSAATATRSRDMSTRVGVTATMAPRLRSARGRHQRISIVATPNYAARARRPGYR
jgi:hypothetical protein